MSGNGSRCIPTWCACRLEPIWTIKYCQKGFVIDYRWMCKVSIQVIIAAGKDPPSLGADAIISATSACVGFCPRARRRSPSVSRGTAPVPLLSKRANASLYSTRMKRASTTADPVEDKRVYIPALSLYIIIRRDQM